MRLLNGFFLVIGVALFAVLLWRLDGKEVLSQLIRAGWMLIPATAAFVGSLVCSTLAWRAAIEPAKRPPFRILLGSFTAGHALNNVAPGASGEVMKGTILARYLATEDVVASIVIYNFLTVIVILAVSAIGPLLCLLWLGVPTNVVLVLFAATAALGVAVFAVWILIHRGWTRKVIRLISRLPFVNIGNAEQLETRALRIDSLVRSFRRTRPHSFAAALAACLGVRMLMSLEVALLLIPLLPERGLGFIALLALLTQSTVQLITVVAAFVPGRIGVTEGGVAELFRWSGLDPVSGFSLILLRRIRKLVSIGIGLALGSLLEARAPKSAPGYVGPAASADEPAGNESPP